MNHDGKDWWSISVDSAFEVFGGQVRLVIRIAFGRTIRWKHVGKDIMDIVVCRHYRYI